MEQLHNPSMWNLEHQVHPIIHLRDQQFVLIYCLAQLRMLFLTELWALQAQLERWGPRVPRGHMVRRVLLVLPVLLVLLVRLGQQELQVLADSIHTSLFSGQMVARRPWQITRSLLLTMLI